MSQNIQIFSPEEIKSSVEQAPAFEIIHELANKSNKESDALLAKGVFLGGAVVDAILEQQQNKHIEHLDEPTL